jgi:hypothetical protein
MADESASYTSGSYHMEMLRANHWMLWKRWMLAILRDLNLRSYIKKESKSPTSADENRPTDAERKALKKWQDGDAKARTRIELAVGDS